MKVILPKIPVGLKHTVTERKDLRPGSEFERVIVRGIDGIALAAQKMKFDEAALDRAILINAALDEISLMDTEVRGCDVSAAVLVNGTCDRVRFTHCRMDGIDLSHATLRNVTFSDCKLSMANFRFAKLQGVVFEDCVFTESDFQLATLSDVTFQNCHLEKTVFIQSTARNTDLRTSHLEHIRGWQSLKGATISYEQLSMVAPELAIELGLHVD